MSNKDWWAANTLYNLYTIEATVEVDRYTNPDAGIVIEDGQVTGWIH